MLGVSYVCVCELIYVGVSVSWLEVGVIGLNNPEMISSSEGTKPTVAGPLSELSVSEPP